MSARTVTRIAISLLLVAVLSFSTAADEIEARATYIANMGVMIERGETKVLFDPLFRNNFDTYDPVPAEFESALLAGSTPWDGIDAVFVSHYHEDHFDPATLLVLLRNQSAIELFAPEQAAAAIRELVSDDNDSLLGRIHGISLANGEATTDVELGQLLVEAVRIPHAGWPNRHSHVENLVFRVTLDSVATITHFGDAEPADEHYAGQAEHWRERHTHLAMPPYWFFLSSEGRAILEERIDADHAVGMHVPSQISDDATKRPDGLQDVDLFTDPGQVRRIPVSTP